MPARHKCPSGSLAVGQSLQIGWEEVYVPTDKIITGANSVNYHIEFYH